MEKGKDSNKESSRKDDMWPRGWVGQAGNTFKREINNNKKEKNGRGNLAVVVHGGRKDYLLPEGRWTATFEKEDLRRAVV